MARKRSSRKSAARSARSSARARPDRGSGRGAGARASAARGRARAKSSTAAGGRGGRTGAARARSGARSQASGRRGESGAIALLKRDHREVDARLKQFQSGSGANRRELAEQICRMLTVHAQIEEEVFYPEAHEALGKDGKLITEARVEHATLKDLIGQLESMDSVDELFEARMQVLGEYVKHHVREEETEVFPRAQRAGLDIAGLGERLAARKQELMGAGAAPGMQSDEEEPSPRSGRGRGGARGGARPAQLHSGGR